MGTFFNFRNHTSSGQNYLYKFCKFFEGQWFLLSKAIYITYWTKPAPRISKSFFLSRYIQFFCLISSTGLIIYFVFFDTAYLLLLYLEWKINVFTPNNRLLNTNQLINKMYAIYHFLIDCNQKPVINSMNLKGRHGRHRHLILLSELV